MQYPQHLLPKSDYKLIEWAEWLDGHYLLRYAPNGNLKDTDTGMLRLDYIVPENGVSQLRDFSTSLLGIFLPEDRFWKFVGERRTYFSYELWPLGEEVEEPVFGQDVERDETRGMFFLRIGDIVGQEVHYNIGDQNNFNATCKVIHTPNRANFWHFSVRWFNQDGDIYPNQRGNWINRMLKTALRTVILENVRFDVPEIHPILEAHYLA